MCIRCQPLYLTSSPNYFVGVVKEFRKNGIASFLLDNLVAHLTNPYNDPPTDNVRALYLHVLTTNSQAIAFYEHRGFRAHLFLPYYYAIKGIPITQGLGT